MGCLSGVTANAHRKTVPNPQLKPLQVQASKKENREAGDTPLSSWTGTGSDTGIHLLTSLETECSLKECS